MNVISSFQMRFAFTIVASLMALATTKSHEAKGPNGGAMEGVAGVHAELVISGGTIGFNIFDENRTPKNTDGFTGLVLILTGFKREIVKLLPAGESAVMGKLKKPIVLDSSITLMLKTRNGRTSQVSFTQ